METEKKKDIFIKFIIKIVLTIFSIISCTVLLFGIIYFPCKELSEMIGFDQLLFHLSIISTMNINKFYSCFLCALIILLCILLIVVIKRPLVWLKLYISPSENSLLSNKIFMSFTTSLICLILGCILVFDSTYNTSVTKLAKQIHIWYKYVHNNSTKGNVYEKYFTDAKNINFNVTQPKNTIIILAESFEESFSDKEIFGENMLLSLQNQQGKSVLGYTDISGTNWTIASQLSMLCGIPFKFSPAYWKNLKNGNFFPNIMCAPEILNNLNYNVYYLQGTYSDFAYTDIFLKKHGMENYEDLTNLQHNFNLQDKVYSNKFIGNTLYDSALLEHFKGKIKELNESDKPFLAMATTMNTHYPKGKNEQLCRNKYNDMRDAIICSSSELAEFAEWFKKQQFKYDTSLIILGDHLMMTCDIQKLLDNVPQRRTLNYIWSSSVNHNIHKKFAQFDWMPTILEISGITWDGHHLGLGTSLISQEATLSQLLGDSLDTKLQNKSDLYQLFF